MDILKENKMQADNQKTPVCNNELSKLKSTPSPNVRIAPSLRSQQVRLWPLIISLVVVTFIPSSYKPVIYVLQLR